MRATLTNFKPEDHPWHYGLWFSWKYINKANYWEEDRQTGKAEGATRCKTPAIETKPDGSALIKLNVTYTHPSGRVDMTESRVFKISAVGRMAVTRLIGWRISRRARTARCWIAHRCRANRTARSTAATPGWVADGRPAADVFRRVQHWCAMERFVSDRARPFAPAIAFNFSAEGRDVGGIALFSDPANVGGNAPWAS